MSWERILEWRPDNDTMHWYIITVVCPCPEITHCNVDMEAPELSCPTNITIPAEDKLHYAKVRWPDPVSRDNSGFIPMVTSIPVVEFPMKFKIGSTEIKVSSKTCFLIITLNQSL